MFGKKKKPSRSWERTVLAGLDTARDWSAPKLGSAADRAEEIYREKAPKVQAASTRALETAGSGAADLGRRARDLSSRASDGLAAQYGRLPAEAQTEVDKVLAKYQDTKATVQQDYVPAASAKLSGYADKTAKLIHRAELDPRVEKALIRATGDEKIVKKLRKGSEQYAKQASETLKKQQKAAEKAAKKAQRSGVKKGLLVFGLVAAGAAAGVAAWRASQPVQDPWKKPEPVTPRSSAAQAVKPASPTTSGDAKAETPVTAQKQPVQETSSSADDTQEGRSQEGGSDGSAVPQPKPAT